VNPEIQNKRVVTDSFVVVVVVVVVIVVVITVIVFVIYDDDDDDSEEVVERWGNFLRHLMKLCLNIENIAGFCNIASFQLVCRTPPELHTLLHYVTCS
jgi:cytosine/uracil/thiamine/allantoin permease